MKNKLLSIFFFIIFLTGFGLVLYPTVSNWINQMHASKVVSNYHEAVSHLSREEDLKIKEKAIEYNKMIESYGSLNRAVNMEKGDQQKTYQSMLNVGNDGVMGVIRIPSIKVLLPIYHTTEENVIQTAVGHYVGSSLPIGGEGSHCLLSGHRGLRSARLFTDLDQLKKGDMFFIDILDETHAYKIDDIKTVLPNYLDSLDVQEGKDYVTLITCTPYGVNTHRLLVRGTRVPYHPVEKDDQKPIVIEKNDSSLLLKGIVGALFLLFIGILIKRKRKGGQEHEE